MNLKGTISSNGELRGSIAHNVVVCDENELLKFLIKEKTSDSVIRDSANYRFLNLIAHGDSWQNQYEGTNCFDISKIETNASLTNNGDGTLTVRHASDTEHILFRDVAPNIKVGEMYVLNADSTGADKYVFLRESSTFLYFGNPFTVTEAMMNSQICFYASYNTNGGSPSDTAIVSNIRINKGNEDKGYEPYVGNAPSPSPQYPQPIESLENVEVKVFVGNILDTNYLKDISNYDTTTLHGNGYDIVKVLVGDVGTVTVSIGQKSNVGYIRVGNIGEIGGTEWLTHPSAEMNLIRTFDVVDGYVYFLVEPYVDLVALIDSFGYIQINVGTEPKPYEPYTEQTLTIPYVLRKGDKVEYASGERLQDTTIMNLSELEWIKGNPNNNGDGTIFYTKRYDFQKYDCLCTHYRNKNVAGWENMGVGEIMHNEYIVLCTSHSTLEEFTSWLETENVQMLTKLADPIITDLTESDLQAYRQLHMNYPNTHILSDAELEVEYVADTKIYTDTLVAEAKKYKTLVDVTLDDSNSGTNAVMAEIDLEAFLTCNEYTLYVELPVSEAVDYANISGYITDLTQNAYALCVLYNGGIISASASGVHRAFSQTTKIKNGMLLSTSWYPTSYTGANSSNPNNNSIIETPPVKDAFYREYPPYIKVSITNCTFPSGTRIIMEGR